MTLYDRGSRLEDAIDAEVVCYARVDHVEEFPVDLPGISSPIGKPVRACEVGLEVIETVKGSHSDKRSVIWRSASTMRSSLKPGNTTYVAMLRRSGVMPAGFERYIAMLSRKPLDEWTAESDLAPSDVGAVRDDMNPFLPVLEEDGEVMWEFAQSIGQFSPSVIEDSPAVRLRLAEIMRQVQ